MGKRIIVIGAGPSGLLSAWSAAANGASVTVLEKMQMPGRKLLITGSGRCNITGSDELDEFVQKYFGNGRFLYPAFNEFFRDELLNLMKSRGQKFVTEPSGKIFPASDKAGDILAVLVDLVRYLNVKMVTGEAARDLIIENERITGVITDNRRYTADAVILATGGQSWPGTGSTGDGYRMASAAGHKIEKLRPALVPLAIEEKWIHDLKGISLSKVDVKLIKNGRKKVSDSGELLFTHYGLSGPVILRLSRGLPDFDNSSPDIANDLWQLGLDLIPHSNIDELVSNWRTSIESTPARSAINCLNEPFPSRLMAALLNVSDIDQQCKGANIKVSQLEKLAKNCKGLLLDIAGTRGYREAMVTAGGVSLKEIDPRSLASRLISGLYFAGEVLDIDGDTGGYNLQAAFSTGVLAGRHAASD